MLLFNFQKSGNKQSSNVAARFLIVGHVACARHFRGYESLLDFLSSWIADAKSQEGENPNGGRTGRSALRTLCLYVWPPVVLTSSCQCSVLAREIKRASRRIRVRSRKCLAAALIHSLVVVT
jgi:hypothetical protein